MAMAIPSRLLDGVVLTFIKENTLYSLDITDRVKMNFLYFRVRYLSCSKKIEE